MSDEKLKPCPFCRGKTTTFLDDDGKWHIWTRCHGDSMHHAFVIADTEAEAIAEWNTRADLGNEREKAKSHPYGYERDTGAYDCTRCECGCINDISAKYCNDCGGEIEIDESAEKEYYDGYSKHTVFAKKHDDGSLEFCERRYVPEESVAHGTLTAEQVREAIERNFGKVAVLDDGKPVEWRDDWVCKIGIDYRAIADELNARAERTCKLEMNINMMALQCSRCGYKLPKGTDLGKVRFCAGCGAKVVE